MPLQGEGAVQGLLAATPNMIEGDLLKTERSQGQPALASGNGGRGRSWGRHQGGLWAVFSGGQFRPVCPNGQRKSWSRALQLRKGRRRHKSECVRVSV